MGQITFEVPPDLPPDRRVGLTRAWFAGGYDGSPVPTRRTDAPHAFTLRRQEAESGYLCVPWRGPHGAERVVTAATLRLTDTPYPALRELARGAINRVRTMHSALASAGLKLPNGFADDVARLTAGFGRVVSGAEESTAFAVALIDTATDLADRAAAALAEYRLTARHQHHGPLTTRVGSRLSRPLPPDQAELYLEAFNAVRREAFDLCKKGRCAEGRERLQSPKGWKVSSVDVEVEKAMGEFDRLQWEVEKILRQENESWSSLERTINGWVAEKKYGEAILALKEFLRDCLQESLRKTVSERIQEVEKMAGGK